MKGQPGPYKDHSHPRTPPNLCTNDPSLPQGLSTCPSAWHVLRYTHSQAHVSPFTTCQSLHQCHLSRRPSLTSLISQHIPPSCCPFIAIWRLQVNYPFVHSLYASLQLHSMWAPCGQEFLVCFAHCCTPAAYNSTWYILDAGEILVEKRKWNQSFDSC